MVFERLFGRGVKELQEEEFIELDTEQADTPTGKVPIKIDKLEDFADTDRIQKLIREGSITLVKIKTLKNKDLTELKRAIDKLRKTCVASNGDIALFDEEWLIITPNFAHVVRS